MLDLSKIDDSTCGGYDNCYSHSNEYKTVERDYKYTSYISNSCKWAKIRNAMVDLVGYHCEYCGRYVDYMDSQRKESLNVHHITYKNLFNERIEDLRVLCERCHLIAHKVKPFEEWRRFMEFALGFDCQTRAFTKGARRVFERLSVPIIINHEGLLRSKNPLIIYQYIPDTLVFMNQDVFLQSEGCLDDPVFNSSNSEKVVFMPVDDLYQPDSAKLMSYPFIHERIDKSGIDFIDTYFNFNKISNAYYQEKKVSPDRIAAIFKALSDGGAENLFFGIAE